MRLYWCTFQMLCFYIIRYVLPLYLPWHFSFDSAAAHFLVEAGSLESEPPCPQFLHCGTKKTIIKNNSYAK